MTNLIRGEAIKMRSTRTAIGFTIAGIALMLLVVLISTLAGEPSSVSDKRDAITIAPVGILFVVFGVVGATGEYRHRTVAPAVLIAPDRLRLLVARALAYGVTAAAVALAMLAVAFAVGIPLMAGNDGPSLELADYAGLLGGGLLSAALGAIMGVGFGALVGNQVAGVVSVLLYIFVDRRPDRGGRLGPDPLHGRHRGIRAGRPGGRRRVRFPGLAGRRWPRGRCCSWAPACCANRAAKWPETPHAPPLH